MKHNLHILAFTLIFVSSSAFAEEWFSVADQKILGISGVAVIDSNHFLVVHDNKKPDQPRLNILSWQKDQKPTLTPLNWCDQNFPIDLEAITAIPGYKNDYLVLESKGKVTRIQLEANNTSCKTIGQIDLPTATAESNMEGLALHCVKKQCLLAWAERGDDKTPAKLSWSAFNVEQTSLEKSKAGSFDFKAPYPENDLRSISDVAIDNKGIVWVSATSDPGDDGFFKSALYKIGSFTKKNDWTPLKKPSPYIKYETENIKIESLVFTPSGLVMVTDDENKGAKVAIKLIKD
jgi:hypothetical protein